MAAQARAYRRPHRKGRALLDDHRRHGRRVVALDWNVLRPLRPARGRRRADTRHHLARTRLWHLRRAECLGAAPAVTESHAGTAPAAPYAAPFVFTPNSFAALSPRIAILSLSEIGAPITCSTGWVSHGIG